MWMILRPSQPWPEVSPFPPPAHPSTLPGPSSTRLACLPHLQVYKKTKREKKINDKKRPVIPYHSHHQRTKHFTRFKGEQKTKKGGKRTSCYTEVLYLGTWKQGCFHTFFSYFQRLCILHWYFLCCLNLCISAIRLKCVYISSPQKLLCFFFFPQDFSSVLWGHL